MPPFHGIHSSSAPQTIGVTICDSSTKNRAVRYTVSETSAWHHSTLPEIRPFSLNLHILIDDKQHLRYYILHPPPDETPFDASHLPTVSSVKNICGASELDTASQPFAKVVHDTFGIQKLWDFKTGLCYTILTARFATAARNSNATLHETFLSTSTNGSRSSQTTPYVIRPASQLPQILASGDLYPLEHGSHSLQVSFNELQFKKVYTEIYGWYIYSWPWLSNVRAQDSVRMKAQKDCQMLAQQCRWRTGGWLLDEHLQRFYIPSGELFPVSPPPNSSDVAADSPGNGPSAISANPNDYNEGPWITDGLYKRARTVLRRKYLMEFPWFELSSLKRKVEYDIGFLHMAWQLVGDPFMQHSEEDIHIGTLQDKDIIAFYNAKMYDLLVCSSDESEDMAKEVRLQMRMEKYCPHINVDLNAMPQNWKDLMSLDGIRLWDTTYIT